MAAKNRVDFRQDLRDEFKTDPNGRIWRNRELNKFLGQAYLQIQADTNFNLPENQAAPDTFATTAGTQEYNLPANFGRMSKILIANSNFPLDDINLEDLYEKFPTQNESGSPTRYYLRNNKIGLHPIPDAAYTLTRLFKNRFTFPDDDTTVIDYDDDEIAGAIVKYAAYLAWSAPRGNRQTAIEKLQDYKELMKAIKLHKIFRQRTLQYKTVRNTGQYYNPKGLN